MSIELIRLVGVWRLIPRGGDDSFDSNPGTSSDVVVTKAADSEFARIETTEDRARLDRGCTRIVRHSGDGMALGEQWYRLGALYPDFLSGALGLSASTAYMFGLAVAPAARRQGLGRSLMRLAEFHAVHDGAEAAFGWIEAGNVPSRRLFASAGYRVVAHAVRVRVGMTARFYCLWISPAVRPWLTLPSRRGWLSRGQHR